MFPSAINEILLRARLAGGPLGLDHSEYDELVDSQNGPSQFITVVQRMTKR
jgi:hypothetical protein